MKRFLACNQGVILRTIAILGWMVYFAGFVFDGSQARAAEFPGYSPSVNRAITQINNTEFEKNYQNFDGKADSRSTSDFSEIPLNPAPVPERITPEQILELVARPIQWQPTVTRAEFLCSLEDQPVRPRYTQTTTEIPAEIWLQQAVRMNDSSMNAPFALDLRDENTLFFVGNDVMPQAPWWLNQWQDLAFRKSSVRGKYIDFQYHQFQCGGVLFGNNAAPFHPKSYVILTQSQSVRRPGTPNPAIESATIRPIHPLRLVAPEIALRYELPVAASISIQVYDANQNKVRSLVAQEFQSAGVHTFNCWDGTDDAGQEVGNGIYLLNITTENNIPHFPPIKLVMLH